MTSDQIPVRNDNLRFLWGISESSLILMVFIAVNCPGTAASYGKNIDRHIALLPGHVAFRTRQSTSYPGKSTVTCVRFSSFLKSVSNVTKCSLNCITAAASHASGISFAASFLSMHICRNIGHSVPRAGISTPGTARSASRKPTASSIGVGCMNIFGFVTSRKKLAVTIGMSFRLAPSAQAAMASARQA